MCPELLSSSGSFSALTIFCAVPWGGGRGESAAAGGRAASHTLPAAEEKLDPPERVESLDLSPID